MKSLFSLFFLASIFCTGSAWAQCQGVNTGAGCVPPNVIFGSPQNNQPQQPPAIWATRWGAIVIDLGTGDAGNSVYFPSKSKAVKAAMRDCEASGSKHCELQWAFHDQCAAVGWGTGHFGVASDGTVEAAESQAMKVCSEGASDCKIAYSGCSYPEQIQ